MSLYRHYKGQYYKVKGEVIHSETLEPLVIYDCLYKNEISQQWARPKSLFLSKLSDETNAKARFERIQPNITTETALNPKSVAQVSSLLKNVFGAFDIQKINERLQNGRIPFALHSAFLENRFVGFKLGYQKSSDTFYSWLGAVEPEFQGWGFGYQLMAAQHQWCQDFGYKAIETKTMNRWPKMLMLNIQFGFQITATEVGDSGDIKIVMRKTLHQNSES